MCQKWWELPYTVNQRTEKIAKTHDLNMNKLILENSCTIQLDTRELNMNYFIFFWLGAAGEGGSLKEEGMITSRMEKFQTNTIFKAWRCINL